MPRTLVVDATPLLSALIGGSALPVLFDVRFRFITTEKTTWEVKRYIPRVVDRLRQAGKTDGTEDHDFDQIARVRVVRTSQLVNER